MTYKEYTLVVAGDSDFEAVYINGKLALQDNSITARDVIRLVGGSVMNIRGYDAERIVNDAEYPLRLKDL